MGSRVACDVTTYFASIVESAIFSFFSLDQLHNFIK